MTEVLPTEVRYNGYTFGRYSHVSISAEMVEDDSRRTIVYHRYRLRVETTIVAEAGDAYVGQHFLRIRQLLSKAGQSLFINHAGFGPPLNINFSDTGLVKDVNFGPKPKVIQWTPVGETNSVEVVWECEFSLPTCDGQSGVRYTGLAAFNYSIVYRIDRWGYTTRTVSGYLEIAMSRSGDSLPDTADAYRDLVNATKPIDYERETTWTLSPDKRRADFTIVDTQIRSPNAFAPGVITIRGNHRVGWSRRQAAVLRNTISVTIELAHNRPRGEAWDIFRRIVQQRVAIANNDNYGGGVMLETLEADEELYANAVSFSLTYRIIPAKSAALLKFFSSSGLFSTLAPWTDWQYWSESLRDIQSHRGVSRLEHSKTEDQIVDLCTQAINTQVPNPYFVPQPPPTTFFRLCNLKPPPDRSYVHFEAAMTSIEDVPTTVQVTIGRDDLQGKEFDPSDPTSGNGETDQSAEIQRFVEEAPAGLEFQWIGYAERLGYDIPKPGKLRFGDVELVRKGKAFFRKKFIGLFFCQPLYAAAWNMRYVVVRRPSQTPTDEADPYNTPYTGN